MYVFISRVCVQDQMPATVPTGPVPPPSVAVVDVLRDIAHGVAHLHSLHIVHRDLKPQNILISFDNRAKIADMGLGKKLEVHRSSFNQNSAGMGGSMGWQVICIPFICVVHECVCSSTPRLSSRRLPRFSLAEG